MVQENPRGDFNPEQERDERGRFGSGGGGESTKPLFGKVTAENKHGDEYAHLGTTIHQNTGSKEQLAKDAKEVSRAGPSTSLNRGTGLDAKLGGGTVIRGDQGEHAHDLASTKGPAIIIGPMKNLDQRAEQKVKTELGGDWSKLGDAVRASIAVDSHEDIPKVIEHLKASGIEVARQPKDRFVNPTENGYRDDLLNVKYPNGHIGEIQIHTKALLDAKGEGGGHKLYERVRDIENKSNGREKTPEESAEINKLNEASKKIFNAVQPGTRVTVVRKRP